MYRSTWWEADRLQSTVLAKLVALMQGSRRVLSGSGNSMNRHHSVKIQPIIWLVVLCKLHLGSVGTFVCGHVQWMCCSRCALHLKGGKHMWVSGNFVTPQLTYQATMKDLFKKANVPFTMKAFIQTHPNAKTPQRALLVLKAHLRRAWVRGHIIFV